MTVKRIILHWTAGTYEPNSHEKNCYHFLIDNCGYIIEGKHKVSDNFDCSDGNYAAHTGGGNTGSIGIALCGMFTTGSVLFSSYQLTNIQCEKLWLFVAWLCDKYKLKVNSETVLTHYEFGKSHPKTSSSGKIDITYLDFAPKVKPADVGSLFRGKINWYKTHLSKYKDTIEEFEKFSF